MGEKTKELAVQESKMELNIDINETTIKNLIYVIRGHQVILDSDLAMLYQVETKNLNIAKNSVKIRKVFCVENYRRNRKRHRRDSMLFLTTLLYCWN